MVSPGAAVVTTGPGIVDIAIVSMFLVMAASAATTALKGGVDGDNYDAGRIMLLPSIFLFEVMVLSGLGSG
jgi:hypothetical protein